MWACAENQSETRTDDGKPSTSLDGNVQRKLKVDVRMQLASGRVSMVETFIKANLVSLAKGN